jgi:hypothetical protein
MAFLFAKGYVNPNRVAQTKTANQDTRQEAELLQYQMLIQERDQLIYNLR